VCHGKGLSRPGNPQQCLPQQPFSQAFDEARDGGGLIARRLETGFDTESTHETS
jgi:hypothetical protein